MGEEFTRIRIAIQQLADDLTELAWGAETTEQQSTLLHAMRELEDSYLAVRTLEREQDEQST